LSPSVRALRDCLGPRSFDPTAFDPTAFVLAALALSASFFSACSGGGSSGPPTATQLDYEGPMRWDPSGPVGGPFASRTFPIVLSNPGDVPTHWWATVPGFAALDRPNGVIEPGAHVVIQASVLDAVVGALGAGTYERALTIHGVGAVGGDISIDCTLSVLASGTNTALSPADDLFTQGASSGPVLPASQVYTLTNTGTTSLTWQTTSPVPWLSVDPAGSTLAPSASVDVTVSVVDPATSGLAVGLHTTVLEWKDSASSAIFQSRVATLNVLTDTVANGWTTLAPSADSRIVYVSSSLGDDGNDGLSTGTPKQSIRAGMALLRDGFPDWLLLRRGDAWDESFGIPNLSGRSPAERMVISAYGPSTERPLLRTGVGDGMTVQTGTRSDSFAVVGLHFVPNLYDGTNGSPRGIAIFDEQHDFLIEDCMLEKYQTNIVLQGASESPAPTGRLTNIAIRRCVIVDAFTTDDSNAEGIFASGTDDLLLEENVFDHNGWRDDVPGSVPTLFRHNIYIQNLNTGVVVRGNIVARTDGVQARSGGLLEDNLVLHNAIGIILGGGGFPEIEPDGVDVTARRNVVLDGGDLDAAGARGWGFHLSNVRHGTVDSNVVAHNVDGHAPFPMIFAVANNNRGIEDTLYSNNVVYDWNGSSTFEGDGHLFVDVGLANNRFQNLLTPDQILVHEDPTSVEGVVSSHNEFYTLAPASMWMQANGPLSLPQWQTLVHDAGSLAHLSPFPDPSRTIGTYHALIGGAPTVDDFCTQARLQSRLTWRTQYTAEAVNGYVRAGYGL
jgi:hypothetical protein